VSRINLNLIENIPANIVFFSVNRRLKIFSPDQDSDLIYDPYRSDHDWKKITGKNPRAPALASFTGKGCPQPHRPNPTKPLPILTLP